MLTDLRLALRALRRAPGYAIAAVVCLGLGLGVNTTVYSLVNALVVRPLPYEAPGRLVAVVHENAAQGLAASEISLPAALDVRERSRTLAGVAAFTARLVNLTGGDRAEALTAAQVSPGFFEVLGVRPVLGRTFRADEGVAGGARVVMLGESLWRTRFAADRAIVGRAVSLDGAPATVIGVAPDGIGLTGDRESLWMPLAERRDDAQLRGTHNLHAVARLRPGVTLAAAAREMSALGGQLAAEFPGTDGGWSVAVLPLREFVVPGDVARIFAVMLGAVGFVLLIACANVANLLLARTAGRTRELAVRVAVGASRARVLRMLLVESVLVSLAGGALGVAVAAWGVRALVAGVPVAYPSWLTFAIDWRVLAYALALSLLTGIAFGLAPALRATRAALAPTLRDGARGASAGVAGRRLRDGLVVAELALSLVLLAGAGLMIKSVLRLQAVDPGFDPRGALAARVYLGGTRYAPVPARAALLAAAVERAAALPGVVAASATNAVPLSGANTSSGFVVEGREVPDGRAPAAETRGVLPGYFDVMRLPLVAGRDFTAAEARDTAAAVVIVNETMAARWWPGASALGRRVSFGGRGAAREWLTVVGVARDVRQRRLGRPPAEQTYLPYAAMGRREMTLVVRTAGDPASLAPALRGVVTSLDGALPLVEVTTMEGVVARSLWQQKLFGALFGVFAAVALVLAVVGVYGVVAYAVSQRVRELGVRVALGARPADVHRLVLGDGARLAGIGLVVGLALAVAVTRVLASALGGVSATDPLVLGGVAATLGGAALLASWLPARRAARVDPVVTLRAD